MSICPSQDCELTSHRQPGSRPLAVTLLAVAIGLLAAWLLLSVVLLCLDQDISFHFYAAFWIPVWHGLLAYGLYALSSWARWGVLIETAILAAYTMTENAEWLFDRFRFHQFDGDAAVTILIAAGLLLAVFLILTHPRIAAAFRPAREPAPQWQRLVGAVVVGIGMAGCAWFLVMLLLNQFLPSTEMSKWFYGYLYHDGEIATARILPFLILLCTGIGILRREAWPQRCIDWFLLRHTEEMPLRRYAGP